MDNSRGNELQGYPSAPKRQIGGYRSSIGASLIVLSFIIGPACDTIPMQSCSQNPGSAELGLCIASMTTTISNAQQIGLDVVIGNRSNTSEVGKAWWVLAPAGSKAPWDAALFISKIDQRIYLAGATADLIWNTPVALPDALYDLALIIHVVGQDGNERHVDLRESGPIRLQGPPATPWLIRREEGAGPVVIESVSGPQPESGHADPFSRTVTVRNVERQLVGVSVRVSATTVPVGWEDHWWNGIALYSAHSTRSVVRASESQELRVGDTAASPMLESFPNVQFWVSVVVDGKTSDDVLIGGPDTFTVRRGVYFRPAAPGPVALTGLAAPSTWRHKADQTFTTMVTNMTGSSQMVQLWGYLAPPNAPRPWADASLQSGPIQFTLSAWTTKTISMRVTRPPIGIWELSAWVHYEAKSATFAHSDALFLAKPITVG